MTGQIEERNQTRDCSKALAHPAWEELLSLLARYGVGGMESVGLIDTSFDAEDIRWNYIIDRKYVLRLTNAPGMTEARLHAMNRLIARYADFGLRCPKFLPGTDGLFFHGWGELKAYLSEYVDLPMANEEELSPEEKDALRTEAVLSLAGFLERYKDVDLIPTMGMYSLFDLCPYDEAVGMDEKQQNQCDSTPEEDDQLIYSRNANWIKFMPQIMKDKPTFFAVGAGHLPGDKGVLQLLRNAGYTIEGVK